MTGSNLQHFTGPTSSDTSSKCVGSSRIKSTFDHVPLAIWSRVFTTSGYGIHDLITCVKVCRAWRECILHNPDIWTTLDLRCELTEEERLGHKEAADWEALPFLPMFLRSQNRPIDITLVHAPDTPMPFLSKFASSLPEKHRWQDLSADPKIIAALFPPERPKSKATTWDLLESITIFENTEDQIDLVDISFSSPRRLKHLYVDMRGRFLVGPQARWNCLLDLDLNVCTPSCLVYYNILRSCPNLQTCRLTFNYLDNKQIEMIAQDGVIHLWKLRNLKINGDSNRNAMAFLTFIRCPALETLSLTCPELSMAGAPPANVFVDFIERSGCKIRRLDLYASEMAYQELHLCLGSVRETIRHLYIGIFNTEATPVSSVVPGTFPALTLGKLEVFEFRGRGIAMPLRWFAKIIKPKVLKLAKPVLDSSHLKHTAVKYDRTEGKLSVSSHHEIRRRDIVHFIRLIRQSAEFDFL